MTTLDRDLGLVSVLAISIGAMIGSGIFILPSLALGIAGPAVILAYLLAAIVVLPAALSKSEMATAMPEAGGTYIFIERGLGPLLGTISGIGTWFALSFKGALALVGGVPYLLLLFDFPLKPVAIGLAILLIGINILGAKQTGRLQTVIVVVMLAALGWFAAGSAPGMQSSNFSSFFGHGVEGLLAATGLVFVSYAGVTKVASVAEEVKDPGRTIPIGILGSLVFTTLLYVGIVTVLVGVAEPGVVSGSATPVAVVASLTLGEAGVIAVILAAILALVSTANAGILSSSRYPFAMARDNLVPERFATVSDRTGTPITAITLTGMVMLALIAFVPITEIAKLASAFQILVFVLINVALIAFREGSVEYTPTFRSPFYPWTQLVGVLTGLVLLTQMGTIPFVGAAVIVVGSAIWYYVYVRHRVGREGVARTALRSEVSASTISAVERSTAETTSDLLVAITKPIGTDRERSLLSLADDITEGTGRILAVRFAEVPDQAPLTESVRSDSQDARAFEKRIETYDAAFGATITSETIISHDTKHAIVTAAESHGVDAILTEHEPLRLRSRIGGDPVDWVVRHAEQDVYLVDTLGYSSPERIVLAADGASHSPVPIRVAESIAAATDGYLAVRHPATETTTPRHRDELEAYGQQLESVLDIPTATDPVQTDGGEVRTPDLFVRLGSDHRLRSVLFDRKPTLPNPGCPTLTIYPGTARQQSVVQRALQWFVL